MSAHGDYIYQVTRALSFFPHVFVLNQEQNVYWIDKKNPKPNQNDKLNQTKKTNKPQQQKKPKPKTIRYPT